MAPYWRLGAIRRRSSLVKAVFSNSWTDVTYGNENKKKSFDFLKMSLFSLDDIQVPYYAYFHIQVHTFILGACLLKVPPSWKARSALIGQLAQARAGNGHRIAALAMSPFLQQRPCWGGRGYGSWVYKCDITMFRKSSQLIPRPSFWILASFIDWFNTFTVFIKYLDLLYDKKKKNICKFNLFQYRTFKKHI